MQPTPKSAHKDAALSSISIGYSNQMFIGDRVFLNVPSKKQSDYFFKFQKGAWFRNMAGVRAPGTSARRGGYPVTSDSFNCEEYALAHPIPIETINNADDALQPWETGVGFATEKVMLAKEKLISDLCMTAGNWTTTDDVAAGWVATADGSGNTFIADILAQKEVIRKLIGRIPNVLLMDSKTFNNCKQEYSIIERIKYTGTQGKPADVTTETLAALFELDEVLIGGAIYSDAEEVVAGTDFNAVDLWEVNATKGAALLFYRPPKPAKEIPAAGYSFNWKGVIEDEMIDEIQSDVYRSVRKWWDPETKSWMVEASECLDPKVTCADAACLFYDTIVT